MDGLDSRRRPGELGGEELELLLQALHPNRERAAEEYLLLNAKLRMYFGRYNQLDPEELAAETLGRVARKLAEGEPIKVLHAYCYGVARLIRLEALRKTASQQRPIEEAGTAAALDRDPAAAREEAALLEHCLRSLPEPDARLFV